MSKETWKRASLGCSNELSDLRDPEQYLRKPFKLGQEKAEEMFETARPMRATYRCVEPLS